MKNKPFILIFSFLLFASNSFSQKVSILGDSYSTYKGYVTPDTNFLWYGIPEHVIINDVKHVEETWWSQLIKEQGYSLEINNSFSGATICHTGYNREDYADRSFITRMDNLGDPDIIFIFGGTNDNWAGSPLGEYQYENWNNDDLYKFRPAFSYLLNFLTGKYRNTKVYNITNTELSEEVVNSMQEICHHYGVSNIILQYIDKQGGHPSISGMKAICDQILAAIKSE